VEALVTCNLAAVLHDAPFEKEYAPEMRHVLNCELTWLIQLLALVAEALKFLMAA